MELIDRYVYAVTMHLSENIREDVSRELRANIEDMLPENATESDIRAVLEKLGNPRNLADEYNQTKRYLIGPGLYDNYLSVLKLVIYIISIVFVCITMLDWVTNPALNGKAVQISTRFFIALLTAPVEGILQGFFWVTLVFAILERTNAIEGKLPFTKKKWSLEELPPITVSEKRKISRVETAFSIFSTVFFTSLIYFKPQLIALYTKDDEGLTLISPIFVNERLKSYIVIIVILAFFQLSVFTWKFISKQWSLPLAIANAVQNMAAGILVSVMASDASLFNQEFISNFARNIKISPSQMSEIWVKGTWIFAAVFIVIIIWDSISGFIKSYK